MYDDDLFPVLSPINGDSCEGLIFYLSCFI